MASVLREALRAHTSISIIGMCKNAGKTTVLNRLIGLLKDDPRVPGLTSIGRDGESVDIVTGTEKPGIWVRRGALVATAADMLRLCDTTREILYTTGVFTPLGEVVVFRALSDGYVQLAGPSMNGQLAELSETLGDLGAGVVLIDGAISRKTLAAPAVSEATILCSGASYAADMETVVADTAYICELLTLPRSAGEHPQRHTVDGALTDAGLAKLMAKPGDEITVRDGSRVLLTRAAYARAKARGIRFTAQTPGVLCCVCVNPFSATGPDFDKDAFRARMAQAVSAPVLNVREMEDD